LEKLPLKSQKSQPKTAFLENLVVPKPASQNSWVMKVVKVGSNWPGNTGYLMEPINISQAKYETVTKKILGS